jgi:cytochrome c553
MSNSKSFLVVALLAAASLAGGACSQQPAGSGATAKKAAGAAASDGAPSAAAKEMFATRCAPCHGTEGKGDGPGSVALNPKPRNYTDAAWQKSVSDDQLRKVVVMGGAAVGKSPIMPASPDLEEKKDVVDGLVKIIRGFGSK